MNEAEMIERLSKLNAETLILVRAGDVLEMIALARSHREMLPRMAELERAVLRLSSETAQ